LAPKFTPGQGKMEKGGFIFCDLVLPLEKCWEVPRTEGIICWAQCREDKQNILIPEYPKLNYMVI